jgi:two-component system, NarL family, response regulator NreC
MTRLLIGYPANGGRCRSSWFPDRSAEKYGAGRGVAPMAPAPAHGLLDGMTSRQTSTVRAEAADRDKTTIVIADDHKVVRQGLRMLLDADPKMQVLAEAGDVPEAERLTRVHRPSVLVLDLNMPGGSSLEAIPRLREQSPDTAIVVLTMQDDPAFARQALRAGALGFVLKEAADEELLQAIRQASGGETYLNPRLGARLATDPPEPAGPPDDLTEREVEVLQLIALGHTNTEIATKLFLSTRTVETHRAHIQQKLRRTARSELVRYALDHGLVGA